MEQEPFEGEGGGGLQGRSRRPGGPEIPRRLFADEHGVLWTAELRRPSTPPPDGERASLLLFWSDTRACLVTLRSDRALSALSDEDLRRHLRSCLSG